MILYNSVIVDIVKGGFSIFFNFFFIIENGMLKIFDYVVVIFFLV